MSLWDRLWDRFHDDADWPAFDAAMRAGWVLAAGLALLLVGLLFGGVR